MKARLRFAHLRPVQGLARLSGAGDAFHFVATVQNLKLYDAAVGRAHRITKRALASGGMTNTTMAGRLVVCWSNLAVRSGEATAVPAAERSKSRMVRHPIS